MANTIKTFAITNAQTITVARDIVEALNRTDNGAGILRRVLADNDVKCSEDELARKLNHMVEKSCKTSTGETPTTIENREIAVSLVEVMNEKQLKSVTARQVKDLNIGALTTQKASAVCKQGVKDGILKANKGENQSAIEYTIA